MDLVFPPYLEPYLPRLVVTVVVVGLALLTARLGRRLVARVVDDSSRRYRGYKLIGRVIGVLVVAVLVLTWAPVRRDMVTLFTVIGTGLAIATREALMSVLGWLHLTIRAPYRQGDRIEVNSVHGDVVDIRLLHTTLVEVGGWVQGEQSTGRLVHVPNNWIILHPVTNDTHGFGFIWNEFSVTLTPESDWKAAQALLEGFVREMSPEVEARAQANLRQLAPHFLVQYSILSPFVYVRVDDHGIRLTLRHLCEVRRRRGIEHALTVRMLESFAEHGGIRVAVK